MTLTERISEDLKQAMKSGDKLRLETLRMIRAGMIELQKRGTGSEPTPEEEVQVLQSGIKKRKESIEFFRQAGRTELVEKESKEIDIIAAYLPKQLTPEELERAVNAAIAQTGALSAKDFGKVMPLVMKEVKGKADGKAVQELVKKKLGA